MTTADGWSMWDPETQLPQDGGVVCVLGDVYSGVTTLVAYLIWSTRRTASQCTVFSCGRSERRWRKHVGASNVYNHVNASFVDEDPRGGLCVLDNFSSSVPVISKSHCKALFSTAKACRRLVIFAGPHSVHFPSDLVPFIDVLIMFPSHHSASASRMLHKLMPRASDLGKRNLVDVLEPYQALVVDLKTSPSWSCSCWKLTAPCPLPSPVFRDQTMRWSWITTCIVLAV